MTHRDDRVTIKRFLGHAEWAEKIVSESDAAGAPLDATVLLALSYATTRSSSAACNLSLAFRRAHPGIDWGRLIAERRRLLSEGMGVDADRLVRTVRELVSPAAAELRAALPEVERAGEDPALVGGAAHAGLQIEVDHDRLDAFCEKREITRLAVFGSVLRADFTPESDVDVIVEIFPGRQLSLFGLASLQCELSDLLGREVDLFTPDTIDPHVRESIWDEAEVVYCVEGEEEA